VESRCEGDAVHQQVIATLGRVEDLRESGRLERLLLGRLLRSGARLGAKAIVVDTFAAGVATTGSARRIGPALAFGRLWEEAGCREVIENLVRTRHHNFALERGVPHRSASPVCGRLRSRGRSARFFRATSIAIDGSMQCKRPTFGATQRAQRPLPQPISKPSASGRKSAQGKTAK